MTRKSLGSLSCADYRAEEKVGDGERSRASGRLKDQGQDKLSIGLKRKDKVTLDITMAIAVDVGAGVASRTYI